MNINKTSAYISYFFQLLSGVILLMAAFPKLTGSPNSVDLFVELGAPNTAVTIGVLEVLAALFLVFNFIPQIGALLSFCVMLGAIIAHASVLGIEVNGDGGQLFIMLVIVLISNIVVMWIKRSKMPFIGNTL